MKLVTQTIRLIGTLKCDGVSPCDATKSIMALDRYIGPFFIFDYRKRPNLTKKCALILPVRLLGVA